MHEHYVSKTTLTVAVLWFVTACLMVAAWVVALLDGERDLLWVGMLAATGIVFSAMAATAQTRLGQLRLGGLIRATAGLEPEDPRGRKALESVR
jgi:hypothetical protein